MQPISRRAAIRYGFGAAAGLFAAESVAACAGGGPPADRGDEMRLPEVMRSTSGTLALTLTAKAATVDVGAAKPVKTYTYDGVLPGRTWEVSAGDTLKIELVNNLPELDSTHASEPLDMSRPHAWTTTNLHTHGMHVSPLGNGDNAFLAVSPGGTQRYDIAIPQDHTGGLFWYHPHKHGGVAQQIRGGMAGAIIVRGAVDKVPEIAAAKEQVMVLQALELSKDFELLDPNPYPSGTNLFFPQDQVLYTVNGQTAPTVTMYPGEVQRWRFVNAAQAEFMALELEGHSLNVVALDGLTLEAPEPTSSIMLSAANRCDVLVKAGTPGTYALLVTPGLPNPHMHHTTESPAPTTAETMPHMGDHKVRTMVTLKIVGEGPSLNLPTTLPAYNPPIWPIARSRTVAYTVELRSPNPAFLTFGINGIPYDPANEPYQPKLGTAEEWTVVNTLYPGAPWSPHVAHIHVNPFKVTKINGKTLDKPLWRDTFVLTGDIGDSFTFETNFADFIGKFPQHCHVVAHEDLGMMEAIEVNR
ncbi:multicopper oxidase family protein [Smaragdicoccus niigatensis]|uniref:multicopper oxidase family protein n=1 Tax=Smaragdicoccus niigatensis TaxID=359359 RepID=UPI0003764AF9|nr:multicopper oxidase domain-containing protein [Smaragdicoccus niigatensis]